MSGGRTEAQGNFDGAPPPAGTVERWAFDLIAAADVESKLAPAAPPVAWESEPPVRRLAEPGRPPELRVEARSAKTPRRGALVHAAVRVRLVHTFLHHEVQAAELMAWAVLAFPAAPREFRTGLVKLALDEVRHARAYAEYLAEHGAHYGAEPVRDWFWERVPRCPDPASFVATVGMGLEGGNLEHTERFAAWFRAAGDARGAELIERVGLEEVLHVRFATRWFRYFAGLEAGAERSGAGGARAGTPLDFRAWVERLPAPLSPILLRGTPLNRAARGAGGMDAAFLDQLAAWPCEPSGS